MILTSEACTKCGGIGCVCLACKCAIDDCECFEDSEPCPCEHCDGSGREPETELDAAPALTETPDEKEKR